VAKSSHFYPLWNIKGKLRNMKHGLDWSLVFQQTLLIFQKFLQGRIGKQCWFLPRYTWNPDGSSEISCRNDRL
jgi:hypothetical protein